MNRATETLIIGAALVVAAGWFLVHSCGSNHPTNKAGASSVAPSPSANVGRQDTQAVASRAIGSIPTKSGPPQLAEEEPPFASREALAEVKARFAPRLKDAPPPVQEEFVLEMTKPVPSIDSLAVINATDNERRLVAESDRETMEAIRNAKTIEEQIDAMQKGTERRVEIFGRDRAQMLEQVDLDHAQDIVDSMPGAKPAASLE